MEDQCTHVLEEGLNFFKESKFAKLDEEIRDAFLPSTTNNGQQPKSPEKDQSCANSPAPPTPPMEEDFIPIQEGKIDDLIQDLSPSTACEPHEEQPSSVIEECSRMADITPPVDETTLKNNDCLSSHNASPIVKKSREESLSLRKELENAMDPLVVPCLQSVKDLRKQFGSKYDLHMKVIQGNSRYLAAYKRKWDLLLQLEDWENILNSSSPNEPYISVENKVDNCGPPEDFIYITKTITPPRLDYLFDKNYLVGCECTRCTPQTCDCTKNNNSDFAYDRIGRVQFEPGKPIYECNSNCYCSVSCRNRVVQRGRTVRVTIFRTPNGCGWGVKTMDPILKNQFVTEYVGELLTSDEAEERGKMYDHVGMTYLFDLDYNDGRATYTIDAKQYGNISHFINHSCDPNLSVYGVWIETLDPQIPQIAFFARRDIKAGEELTFDYLMYTEASTTSKSKPKPVPCFCGAKNCRKYML